MRVIDLSSSPEPQGSSMTRRIRSASSQPGPSQKRARLAAREPSVIEVIELTDSDSEQPIAPSRKARTYLGPSTSNATHIFGEPNPGTLTDALAPAPGSSQRAPRQEQQWGAQPLFLPGDDDEIRAVPHQRDLAVLAPASILPQQVARQEQEEYDPLQFLMGNGDEMLAVRLPPELIPRDAFDHAPVEPQPLAPEPKPPAPLPPAPPPLDPVDVYIARVLEVVPDVQPTHVLVLVEQLMQSQPGNVVEFALHALLENPSYPKVDKKGKHKRDELEGDLNARASPRPKVDYTSKERVYNCGPHYLDRSLEQLMMDFPRIPKPHIRSRLLDHQFYAPTYLLLAEELNQVPIPFKLKTINSVVSKGKIREDPEFDREREWVLLRVAELAKERDAALATSVNEHEYQDNGAGIECGCCFSDYPFDQMIQCPEAHLFCKTCMTSYASNLLGEHNPNIVCMDQSGCKLPFPESELNRFLSSKLLELYHRVRQRKEIEAAGLENLEECPFCEYKCVIENEMEKLFRCENTECNAITCRACKKPDHLPKTCKEADEDKHLDVQHVIEEAMTQALMRNCPKCQKSFIKEMGCNKMTCPNCRTVSCYICRKVINGYDHFSNPPHGTVKSSSKSKCNLWDPVEQRHAEEVSEAAKRALAELRKTRPDVDAMNIKVDLPKQAPARQPPLMLHGGLPFPGHMAGGMGGMGAMARLGGMAGLGLAGMPAPPMAMGMGMGMGMGGLPGAGAGAGAGAAEAVAAGWRRVGNVGAGNPFMFGAGQAHQFLPQPFIPEYPGMRAHVPPDGPAVAPAALMRAPPPHIPPPPAVVGGGGGRRQRRRR